MSLDISQNMISEPGWYIFSTDISGNRWNDFQESWGIVFAEIESNIYNISSSEPVDISMNITNETVNTGGGIFDIPTITVTRTPFIPNDRWIPYDISTNPIIHPFSPYWVHVLAPSYGMTQIIQNETDNQITKYIDARGILGYNSYVNTVDIPDMISITIGSLVDTISYNAFTNCPKLEVVNISNSVKFIQGQAFKDCITLTTVIFQEGSLIDGIDMTTFNECTNLSEVYMTETLLNKLGSVVQPLAFGMNVSFFGASNITIKHVYEITKYTV